MVYFMAVVEGGLFKKIKSRSSRPKIIIKHILSKRCVAVFKNGMVYDGLLPEKYNGRKLTALRGRRWGKKRYKELFKIIN